MTDTAIVWFRRDLRLADNPALDDARAHHDRLVPLFVFDPDAELPWPPGAASRWWLHHSLSELNRRLCDRGSRLILALGDPLKTIERVSRATGAGAVYWNRRYEPGLVEQDRGIKQRLLDQDLTVRTCNGSLLVEPWNGGKSDGEPYRMFTPFWKQMQKRWAGPEYHAEPRELAGPKRWPDSLAIDELGLLPEYDWPDKLAQHWAPGELGARRRLDDFAGRALNYHILRDRPGRVGTSRLSPHLHFGEVSPGQVMRALDPSGELPGGKGRMVFVSELAWREFSYHLLWHFPHIPDRSMKEAFRAFPWRSAEDYGNDLSAWRHGRTGIPLVDAGMRELRETGWMHNRARMIVASFLTKNLLIPWQEGARWFWDMLVDADLANNTQGWQWTAGCGADAAPYFRVFNPVLQGEKFDPGGDYVRRWCPELCKRESKQVHQPLDAGEAKSLGYPQPIVDLKGTRRRALDAWQSIRN